MMIIAFGELIIFLGLVGLSAPGGSHCYWWRLPARTTTHHLSGKESSRDVSPT
jgi:hypothetical protein